MTFLLMVMYSWIPFLFWCGNAILGLWICTWSLSQIHSAQDSATWPTVNGHVQTATIDVGGGRFGKNFWPVISYTYHVSGKDYTNDTIIFGQNGPATHIYAQEKVQQYAPNTVVPVYYNPRNPQVSCLEPGQLVGQTYLGFGIGVFFIMGGVGGLSQALRKPKQRYFL